MKIICWDLDDTLIADEIENGVLTTKTRPGIQELLANLKDYTHVVTTAAQPEYAEKALTETGLKNSFARVFAADKINHICGKLYRPVIETLGREILREKTVIKDYPVHERSASGF